MDDDGIRYAISARKHLAKGLRSLATGVEAGVVPLTEHAWQLLRQLFDECLPPAPPAEADKPPPPAG